MMLRVMLLDDVDGYVADADVTTFFITIAHTIINTHTKITRFIRVYMRYIINIHPNILCTSNITHNIINSHHVHQQHQPHQRQQHPR